MPQDELPRLRRMRDDALMECARVRGLLAASQKDVEDRVAKHAAMRAERDELEAQVVRLRGEIEAANRRADAAEVATTAARHAAANFDAGRVSTIGDLKAQIADLQGDVAQLRGDLDEAKQVCRRLRLSAPAAG